VHIVLADLRNIPLFISIFSAQIIQQKLKLEISALSILEQSEPVSGRT